MIKIPYKDGYIECTTIEEAIGVIRHLAEEEIKAKQIVLRRNSYPKEYVDEFLRESEGLYESIQANAWTRESFSKFIESIGKSQKRVLSVLVCGGDQSDDTLRKVLKIDSNQALAGVLSGISKQAGILNISARAVYTMKDERRAGELHKTYAAADDFLQMCHEMNWPEEWPDRKKSDATAMSKP